MAVAAAHGQTTTGTTFWENNGLCASKPLDNDNFSSWKKRAASGLCSWVELPQDSKGEFSQVAHTVTRFKTRH